MPGLLEGKRGLILGVANKRSIAWGIAKSCSDAGAKLAFTYQGERLEENVRSLAEPLPGSLVVPCDVTQEEQVDAVMSRIDAEWGGLDFLAHCVAYAKAEDLDGGYTKTRKDGFDTALGVSAYSFTLLCQKALPLFEKAGGGSAVTLSYLGGERVMPGYNVMGVAKAALECSVKYLAADLGPKSVRVNAISAGPVNTLAARGISGFTDMLKMAREKVPLRKNTEPEEVGDTALFLFSQLSRGITGEVIYVDGGYHILAY
ncbi:MAG: Enoyl-[acyl-carrier-protein] reductase [NADH] FabI [Candidatus Omnitrophica bacterium]|nr:Enoyl-[acyl-carrier-protein] reductase [NADH] FabI [Candidatus Omnitrophota bacterium]